MIARPRPLLLLLALAILAIGVGLRTWHLFDQPFWLDEAYSAYAADHGLRWLWTVMPLYESHPPLYYALLHGWSLLFGETLASRRVPGLLAGVGAMLAVAAAARRLGRLGSLHTPSRAWIVIAALGLAAVHPLLIDMSRQARPYAPMTAVYALALLPLLRLAADRQAGRPPGRVPIAGVALAETAMLWLHSLGPLWAAALGLALASVTVAPTLTRRDWLWLLGSQLAAAILWAPAALILVREAPGWVGGTWLTFSPAAVPSDLGAIYCTWDPAARLLVLALAAAGVFALRRTDAERRVAGALLLMALLPPIGALLASATLAPVFLPRVLCPAALPAILLVARGAIPPERAPPVARLLPPLGLALLLLLMAHTAWQLRRIGPQQDWYRVTAWLGQRVRPGDAVWAYPNDAALPLDYALADRGARLPVLPVPGPVPAIGIRGVPAGGARGILRLYPDDIARLAASPAGRRPPTIWLVELTSALFDPAGDMPRALARTRRRVDELRTGPIAVTGFRR